MEINEIKKGGQMFTTTIAKEEEGNIIISFYAKVATEEIYRSLDTKIEEQIKKHVRKEVINLLEKPLKARVTRELKKALGEEANG